MVELLVVLTITGILSVLAVSSVSSLRSTALSASGNQLVDVFAMARQNSISKNDFTAVVILTSGTAASSAYCLIELPPNSADGSRGSDWVQLSPWKYLPKGVVFEKGLTPDPDTFVTPPATAPTTATMPAIWSSLVSLPSSPSTLLTNFPFQGSQINLTSAGNAVVQCFQPDGTIKGGQPLTLRLIQGTADSSGASSAIGSGNEYYDVYFVSNTGTTKIGRP